MKTYSKKGFTLVEIMVVMAIIAVLATLVIGAVQLARRTATETTHRSNARAVQTALEGSFAKYRAYCATSVTSGRATCGSNISFMTISGSAQLNVRLGTAYTGGSCATTNAGGGSVTVSASSYIITPQNNDCTEALTHRR